MGRGQKAQNLLYKWQDDSQFGVKPSWNFVFFLPKERKKALACQRGGRGAGRISHLWCPMCHFLGRAPFGESGWFLFLFFLAD